MAFVLGVWQNWCLTLHRMNDDLLQSWLRLSDGRQHLLVGTCTLGRAPDSTLQVEGEAVSRKHAIVQAQGKREFWLVDLGSTNGTFLNGRRVSQAVRLRNGDVVRIAELEIEFVTEILSALHLTQRKVLASTLMTLRLAQCWLMVADIEGSTKLVQELPTEEYPRVTGGWFKKCRQIVEQCGGHISQYLGDGFFCFWEDGPTSADQVRQALAELGKVQDVSSPPFRVVLHYGSVALGSVPTMSELNLHGAEVNFVFRMEKIAAGLRRRMLFSDKAVEMLAARDEVTLVGEKAVAGFDGTFPFFAPA